MNTPNTPYNLVHSNNSEGLLSLADILVAPILDNNTTIIYAYNNTKDRILGAIAINISHVYDFNMKTVVRYGVIEYIASRQKGIGTVLIQASEQWFKDHIDDMTHPLIHVVSIKTSTGFYSAMGFEFCPEHDTNYIGLNTMRKNID